MLQENPRTETPVNKLDPSKNSPENLQNEERNKLSQIEQDWKKYLSEAPAPVVQPNGESYSREANNLVYTGITAAETSYKDIMEQGKNSGISPESEKKIYELYRNSTEAFEKKIRDLQNDPNNIKDPKKFQDELNKAIEQFENELVRVAQEANGIVNAPGAQKNAMDAQKNMEQEKIALNERQRLAELMGKMLAEANEQKMLERKKQLADAEAANRTAEAGEAEKNLYWYVGWTPETDSAAQKKNG